MPLNAALLCRAHLMEHIRPGVCKLLAAGQAASVRWQQPHLEVARGAGAIGRSHLDWDHQAAGQGSHARIGKLDTLCPACFKSQLLEQLTQQHVPLHPWKTILQTMLNIAYCGMMIARCETPFGLLYCAG